APPPRPPTPGSPPPGPPHAGAPHPVPPHPAAPPPGAPPSGAPHPGAPHPGSPHADAPHSGAPHPGAPSEQEQQVLDRIERVRRRPARVREERITLAHGSGGKATQTLVEAIFLESFRNPMLEPLEDAAEFGVGGSRLALTTDSFVVSPLLFPGGHIRHLPVDRAGHGPAGSRTRPPSPA